MSSSKPLISVVILSYNNYRYFYEALDSLLQQDYPNIELILSNDGSADFDEQAIKQYLDQNKGPNIKNVVIRNNKQNLGTVKSINNAIKVARGKYVNFFAADDAFYDTKVLSNFMQAFHSLSDDEYIVAAQLGMYDIYLDKVIKLFVDKTTIKFLKNASPLEAFNEMSTRCLVAAASTCYKKELFEKYGYFDERYRLVEDWSSALRFSRLGIKFNYFDFIAFKHRDGGISHGNVHGEVKLNRAYDEDILNIMKYEVKPYLKLLSDKQKEKFMATYSDCEWRFAFRYRFTHSTRLERRDFVLQNFQLMSFGLYRDLRQYLIDQLVGKKLKIFLFATLFLLITSLPIDLISNSPSFMLRLIRVTALIIMGQLLFLTVYQLYKIIWTRMIKLIKFVI